MNIGTLVTNLTTGKSGVILQLKNHHYDGKSAEVLWDDKTSSWHSVVVLSPIRN